MHRRVDLRDQHVRTGAQREDDAAVRCLGGQRRILDDERTVVDTFAAEDSDRVGDASAAELSGVVGPAQPAPRGLGEYRSQRGVVDAGFDTVTADPDEESVGVGQ